MIRSTLAMRASPLSEASSARAVWNTIERPCSAVVSIFSSCRRISGRSIRRFPKAVRLRAMNSASLTDRRIIPAERTPFASRELLIMSVICLKPWPGSPTM